MKKKDELERSDSCLGKAKFNEMLFVLLARDEAAPATIEAWVRERIRLGKNTENDPQITEALECAQVMREQQPTIRREPV